MPEALIATAWQRAFWAQPPTPGRLLYSERGGQYGGNAYRNLLQDHQDHQDQRAPSRRGDCAANAPAQSRWSRLKTQVLARRERLGR